MARYAWVMEVRPGYEEEYKRRHDEIWPEMLDMFREAGIRDYAIFRYGLKLFGTFATDDLDRSLAVIRESDVSRRWAEAMAPMVKRETDPRTGFHYLLPLQWHLEAP